MGFLKNIFGSKTQPTTDFNFGDIFYSKNKNEYFIYKVILHHKESETVHVLTYKPLNKEPTIIDLDSLEVLVYHSPISSKGFSNPVLLTNKAVTKEDIAGYEEFCNQMEFKEGMFTLANHFYLSGLKLTDSNNHRQAIKSYELAYNIFPQFFEAIDNCAFCFMDLGEWENAIKCFKQSLEVNPNSFLATFSIGESHLKNGNPQKALDYFSLAKQINPSEKAVDQFINKAKSMLN